MTANWRSPPASTSGGGARVRWLFDMTWRRLFSTLRALLQVVVQGRYHQLVIIMLYLEHSVCRYETRHGFGKARVGPHQPPRPEPVAMGRSDFVCLTTATCTTIEVLALAIALASAGFASARNHHHPHHHLLCWRRREALDFSFRHHLYASRRPHPSMARLNEAPLPTESVDACESISLPTQYHHVALVMSNATAVKRRFIRQNRELAKYDTKPAQNLCISLPDSAHQE
jgi:hypothetical protein